MADAGGSIPSTQGTAVSEGGAPHSGSAKGQAAALSVAVLLALLLVDLAVETFIAAGPVRWVPVIAVAAYVGATALLWKRRPSSAALAWLGLFTLLTVLAVTAWMAGGTTAGVVALRQPTSRILALTAATGVLLSVISFLRVKSLPLPARTAVGLLGLYALWALGWGIILQTPYPSLLHGVSAWQRLPFWLQGAFIGSVILLPAGLVAHVLAVRAALHAGTAGSWARRTVVLVLICCVAGAGVAVPSRAPAGTTGWVTNTATGTAAPPASTFGAYPPAPASLPYPAPPSGYEEATARVDGLLQAAKKLEALVEPAMVDVSARAQSLGTSVDASFGFVQRHVRFEPYAGVLRGARGALVSGAANALDRSLLLAELLAAHGRKCRLAHGRLSESAAQQLLGAPSPRQVSDGIPDSKVRSVLETSAVPNATRMLDALRAHAEDVQVWIRARATADRAMLEEALGGPEGWFRDTAYRQARDFVRDHYWVQVEQDGNWLDLDASFPSSRPGQRFTEPAGVLDPQAVAGNLLQSVRFSVTVEHSDGVKNTRRAVLDVTLPTRDLVLDQVQLVNGPVDLGRVRANSSGGRQINCQAALIVGSRAFAGSLYGMTEVGGAPKDAAGPGLPTLDLGGSLFGEGPAAPAVLKALWLDVTLSAPGQPPLTERRYFLGGPTADLSGAKGAPADRRALVAARSYDIVVMPAPYPKFLFDWLWCRAYVSNERLLKTAAALRYGRADTNQVRDASAKATHFSPQLAAMASILSEKMSEGAAGGRTALQRPFVAMMRQGFALTEGGQRVVAERALDIVSPGLVSVEADQGSRASSGLAIGSFLTSLELALARQMAGGVEPPLNASLTFERARAAGHKVTLLREQGREIRVPGFSADNAGLREELGRGRLVVVADKDAQQPACVSWYSVNPDTGVAIGVSATGEGQAITRTAVPEGRNTERLFRALGLRPGIYAAGGGADTAEYAINTWTKIQVAAAAFGLFWCEAKAGKGYLDDQTSDADLKFAGATAGCIGTFLLSVVLAGFNSVAAVIAGTIGPAAIDASTGSAPW